ncbi:hypothetical protein ACFX13_016765 [Malus domestica]|uniref:DUF1677 domain-containing protein n=1 Tax=Malus domestica TaxID=3750 RepID=A0A498HND6_MALDO|nr:uncharacterized protein LOC103455756 [Malus domestica]XP_050128681.1 uncharacterized protein LOC126605349 [Malus sylvestris]RXH73038.1 hypothetical protein DVH24_012722 [Malus domestica]
MESAEAKRISEPDEEEVEVKCYCCGLTEECTPAYVATVKERHQDRWICGLCAEAIKDENSRSSRKISTEEAMKRHVSFCEEFRMSSPPAKPTEYLISAMKQLLRRTKDSQRRERLGGCRPGMVRSKSCFATVGKAQGD